MITMVWLARVLTALMQRGRAQVNRFLASLQIELVQAHSYDEFVGLLRREACRQATVAVQRPRDHLAGARLPFVRIVAEVLTDSQKRIVHEIAEPLMVPPDEVGALREAAHARACALSRRLRRDGIFARTSGEFGEPLDYPVTH